jgi:hypothetical protein
LKITRSAFLTLLGSVANAVSNNKASTARKGTRFWARMCVLFAPG